MHKKYGRAPNENKFPRNLTQSVVSDIAVLTERGESGMWRVEQNRV